MKIAHLADIHLGELAGPISFGQNARMRDTENCMRYAAGKLAEEKPDVILIAGDLFHKSKLWADEMLREIRIASIWLRRLTEIAPVVLMFGTENHDNIEALKNINAMEIPRLTVIFEPGITGIAVNDGMELLKIAAIPGMDRGYFRTMFPGMDKEDENKTISDALGNIVMGLSSKMEPHEVNILMAHYSVTGCVSDNGESLFLNSDIVLPAAALQASEYDLVCLGHIHKEQSIPNCGRPVYYSGPLNGITFNEEDQRKGFYIHDIIEGAYRKSKFIETPYRQFKSLLADESEIQELSSNGYNISSELDIENKIVRVIYSCTDETNKIFNKKALEDSLYKQGAFYVSEIRPSKILTTTDKKAMSEHDTIEDNLKLYLENQDVPTEDIEKTLNYAETLIREVSASTPTGKISGIFEPVSMEVKNYRSYKEENFDFADINFATVNGPNGIGKSSFFMDAVADCLFEEPREGDLAGWISSAADVKSGAMTFTFKMGENVWRVIRTRAKSGKTTLALQKQIENGWEDHSGSTKNQTQEKILNVLGMDSMTFKSCALIMQDNYGLFLEADKTERMQVLSNILGLNVYDQLHDIAKEALRETNRTVQNLKQEISVLDEKLNQKAVYQNDLTRAEEEKNIIKRALTDKEQDLKAVIIKLERIKEINTRINVLREKYLEVVADIRLKTAEVEKITAEKDRAQNIVDKEETILCMIQAYDETKDIVTGLKAKQPLLNEKRDNLKKTESDIESIKGKLKAAAGSVQALNLELQRARVLEEDIKKIPEIEKKLTEFEERKQEKERLAEAVTYWKDIHTKLNMDYINRFKMINLKLKSCEDKAALIENSGCSIDKPSCNFLADAIEARDAIPTLKKDLEGLGLEEVNEAKKAHSEAAEAWENYQYNKNGHDSYKIELEHLNKNKLELAGMSGKAHMLLEKQKQEQDFYLELMEKQDLQLKLQTEVSSLAEKLNELPDLETKLEKLNAWNKGKEELPAAKQILINANNRLETLKSEIEVKNDERCNINRESSSLDEELNFDQRDFYTESDKTCIEEEIKRLNTEKNNIEVAAGIAQAKINDLKEVSNERIEKEVEISAQAKTSSLLAILEKAFSIDGVPFQIVRSVVAELSAKSNEILSQMTGGKMSIEFKMDKVLKNKKEVNALEIWFNDYQRGTMPYLSRSGGQKVKAALSVAFALADLKANTAGIQLGMMFIHEPPFLDADGVQAYADALELMHQQYNNMKVIAISHDPAMKARFPQSIDVIDAGDEGSKITFNK